jgi:hypothetical protein
MGLNQRKCAGLAALNGLPGKPDILGKDSRAQSSRQKYYIEPAILPGSGKIRPSYGLWNSSIR